MSAFSMASYWLKARKNGASHVDEAERAILGSTWLQKKFEDDVMAFQHQLFADDGNSQCQWVKYPPSRGLLLGDSEFSSTGPWPDIAATDLASSGLMSKSNNVTDGGALYDIGHCLGVFTVGPLVIVSDRVSCPPSSSTTMTPSRYREHITSHSPPSLSSFLSSGFLTLLFLYPLPRPPP
jgi:hypothetical protein